jgi:hypothetical protein
VFENDSVFTYRNDTLLFAGTMSLGPQWKWGYHISLGDLKRLAIMDSIIELSTAGRDPDYYIRDLAFSRKDARIRKGHDAGSAHGPVFAFTQQNKRELCVEVTMPLADRVVINMYALSGALVKTIVDRQVVPPGRHSFRSTIATLPCGTYIVSLSSRVVHARRRILLVDR